MYFVGFVILFHLAVFVVEAFLWMHPAIHGVALAKLNDVHSIAPMEQAHVLRALFVNQGFYNLFLACTAIIGVMRTRAGDSRVGYALMRAACFAAAGAGIVLALTTTAYIGAFLQAAPAIAALFSLRHAASPSKTS